MKTLIALILLTSATVSAEARHIVHHKPTASATPTPAPQPAQSAPVPTGNTVVLPAEFQNHPVIVADTPEFQAMVSKNTELQKQLEEQKKQFATYQAQNDTLLATKAQNDQDVADKLEKMEASQHKWNIFGWVLGSLGFLIPAALVALCVFDPAIIPVVFHVVLGVFNIVAHFFGSTLGVIGTALSTHLHEFEQTMAAHKAAAVSVPPVVVTPPVVIDPAKGEVKPLSPTVSNP